MSCDVLELEILDEYEQDVQMNLDFSGDILYLLDQSISKDTLTIKHIHLNNGENKDSVLENYINCMGTISGNGEFLQWYESYDAGEFSSVTGLTLKAIQYITYLDGNLQGNRFRRLCQYSWGIEDYIWTEWNLQENFYVTNVGEAMNEEHLSSLIKYDNLPYFFTTGAGLISQIGKGPFIGARSNNIINCTDITNGKIWEIDVNNKNIENLSNYESSVIYLDEEFFTKEDIANYPFEPNKLYHFIISEDIYHRELPSGPYICFIHYPKNDKYACIDLFNYRYQESYHLDTNGNGDYTSFQYYKHPDLSPYIKTWELEILPGEDITEKLNEISDGLIYVIGQEIEPFIVEQKEYGKYGPLVYDDRLNKEVNANAIQIKTLLNGEQYKRLEIPYFWDVNNNIFKPFKWTEWEKIGDIANIDQTYTPESKNAQSGIAVAKAISTKLGNNRDSIPHGDSKIGDGDINSVSFGQDSILWIDWCPEFYDYDSPPESRDNGVKYTGLSELRQLMLQIYDEGGYFTPNNEGKKNVENALQEIGASLGNIDAALDELHAYAQGFIEGGAAE